VKFDVNKRGRYWIISQTSLSLKIEDML